MACKRVKIYGVPVDHFVGRGTSGPKKLQEELEARNDGMKIAAAGWLGRASDVKTRFSRGTIETGSVTFQVLGETAVSRL